MFPEALDFAAAVIVYLFVGIVGAAVIWAIMSEIIERSVELYRRLFGIEGEYRRTREALDAEGRAAFDEALERLHIEAVSPERPDEETLRRWRKEDEVLPGDARRV